MLRLRHTDFAESFGTTVDGLGAAASGVIDSRDFSYEHPTPAERDLIVLRVLKAVDTDQQKVGDPSRHAVWERGWGENLKKFSESGGDPAALIPGYLRPNQVLRYRQQFVTSENPRFELDYFDVFRRWLLTEFASGVDEIYEFGCGTGYNLATAAQLFPDKQLHGLDFTQASVDLVAEIARKNGYRLRSRRFDMRTPDESLTLDTSSAVFTIGSLEQLAGDFESFLQFLLARRPRIVVNMEPTIELYDSNNLLDYLAIRLHEKRGYTMGYLPRLQELAAEGRVEILKIKRLYFGNLLMEGYSYVAWRPL